MIIWQAYTEYLEAIPVGEAWETQLSVFFIQVVVIVCLHALLLDRIVDIFVLFTGWK
jgi:hypothetical protein